MKKIKDRHSLINGCVFGGIGIILIISYFVLTKRVFLGAGVFSLLFAVLSFGKAYSRKGLLEDVKSNADERDIYLTMICSKTILRILNYLCYAACLVSLVLYGIFKSPLLLAVAGTACAFIIVMFGLFLCVNLYYEKRL